MRSSGVMPPSPVVVLVPIWRGAAAQRFLGVAGQRAEAHAGDGDGDLEMDRLLGEAGAEHHVGAAFLAIAFERIARDRGAEEQQVVEVRHPALGAGAADVIDAGLRGAMDLGDGMRDRRSTTSAAACRRAWSSSNCSRYRSSKVSVLWLPRQNSVTPRLAPWVQGGPRVCLRRRGLAHRNSWMPRPSLGMTSFHMVRPSDHGSYASTLSTWKLYSLRAEP